MATGIRGNDCPVPQGGLFGMIDEATHNAWCECMYTGNDELLGKCKLKGGLDPSTWKYIALPWTSAGKAARGLPDAGVLGQLITTGIDKATKIAEDTMNGKGPIVDLVNGNTTPAGAGGPAATTNPNNGGFRVNLVGAKTGAAGPGLSLSNPNAGSGMGTGWAPPNVGMMGMGSSTPLLLIGAAVAAWMVFQPKASVSVGGFGGYRKRRSRRSRR